MARAPRTRRRALAALVSLLAAGCSVEVEGARCETPFAPGQCPDGQGCGNDRLCSKRAAACAAPEARCCPEGTEGCTPSPLRCGDGAIQRCAGPADAGDAVCGTWVTAEACAAGFVCRADAGAPACLCPLPDGPALVADAAEGSPADATPPPTGAAVGAGFVAPASCRFRSLADALDAAAARGPGGTVDAVGTFRTSRERALAVPPGVTLRPLAGESAALEVDGAVGAALALAAGASVEDLVVRSADQDAAGDAIAVACADATPVSLARVRVEHAAGAARLAAGLRVGAPCAVRASDLTVDGAAIGVAVGGAATPSGPADVTLTGAALHGCGRGAEFSGGRLYITDSTIDGSSNEGLIGTADDMRSLTLLRSRIARNGDGGIVMQSVIGLDVRATTVCGNGAETPRGTFSPRPAGGVVLLGNPPAPGSLVFRGNRVFANAGDQILVGEAGSPWMLDGAASAAECAADANYIGGYPADPATARGLFAATADVSAIFNAWAGITPTPPPTGRDYEATTGHWVDAGRSGSSFCAPPDPLPTCD